MKAKLIRDMQCQRSRQFPTGIKKAGTLIDHRDAFRLVQMGVAEPADAECDRRAGMSPEAVERAKKAYERVTRGIHPEDYAAYDDGLMDGYNPDGSWIPGPNYVEEDEGEGEGEGEESEE